MALKLWIPKCLEYVLIIYGFYLDLCPDVIVILANSIRADCQSAIGDLAKIRIRISLLVEFDHNHNHFISCGAKYTKDFPIFIPFPPKSKVGPLKSLMPRPGLA